MKERILKRFDEEIHRGIEVVTALSRNITFYELSYLIYVMHLTRLARKYPEECGHSNPALIRLGGSVMEETLKYLIQCSIKFGRIGHSPDRERGGLPDPDGDLIGKLIRAANLVNAKYDAKAFINLFDVKPSGEKEGYLKIDMDIMKSDPNIAKFFEYFGRIDRHNDTRKSFKKSLDEFLEDFRKEYEPYNDLFYLELGIPLENFLNFNRHIVKLFQQKLQNSVGQFPRLPNGNVDTNNLKSLWVYTMATLLPIDEVKAEFASEVDPLFQRLTFDSNCFDESNLRYHMITRAPIIKQADKYVQICPELLLDSLFTNVHYIFLEGKKDTQELYKARAADQFVNKIASICRKFGYDEVCRALKLREGKRDLGDIDLVLRNGEQYLLIEAKNHVLPLDVYFKDFEATQQHLHYLQEKWEKPVMVRVSHLEKKSTDYGISKPFTYIIVSKFPEIISHYSDFVILDIQELEDWLKHPEKFADFYSRFSEKFEHLSYEDLQILRKGGFIPFEIKK